MQARAIVIDTETTCVDKPEVIEVAYLEITNHVDLSIGQEYWERFRPNKPITFGAMATHHIVDSDLVACRPSSEFRLPDGVEYIIGHNIDFDWKAIGSPDVRRICTLALARSLFPECDSHTLSAVMYYLLREGARSLLKDAHSAIQDVHNCRTVLDCVMEKLPGTAVCSWEALWQASERARIPTVMAFGKHKGTPIKHLPRDYVAWLLRQPDIDPYLRQALGR